MSDIECCGCVGNLGYSRFKNGRSEANGMPEERQVLVCGLVCADFFNICEHYPVEDSDEHIVKQYWQRGGNASNTSTVLAKLGSRVEFFGVIPANSMHRRFFESDMTKRKISYQNCVYYESEDCAQATVICNLKTGSRTIMYTNRQLSEITYDDFCKLDLRKYAWTHFEGRRNTDEIVKMLNHVDFFNAGLPPEKRVTTSVELEKKRECLDELRDKADFVFIGKDHAVSRGYLDPESTCIAFSANIRDNATVIVPWGEQGARAMNKKSTELIFANAQPPPKIIDSTGAGDTFIGATIYKLHKGDRLENAIRFGCKIAGRKIGDFGFDHIISR